jgi:hypothetical protein
MSSPRFRLVVALLAGGLGAAALAQAPDLPRRKPGLWETQMNMTQAPGGGAMKSQQCVDEKSDAEAMQRSFGGEGRCEQKSFKKTAAGFEAESVCKTAEGVATSRMVVTGDMQRRYEMDNLTRFEPPRRGMKEATMKMTATWLGACPPDLKPGQVRMAGGAAMTPGQPGMSADRLKSMSPEERRKAVEAMMKNMPK